jgi:protein subunit release factor A
MKLSIEIRPGEGGDDAKLLVNEQANLYIAFAKRHSLRVNTKAAVKG